MCTCTTHVTTGFGPSCPELIFSTWAMSEASVFEISVDANNETFILLNNGGDDCWDTLGVGMTDYTISAPGVYMLSDGIGMCCGFIYDFFVFLIFLTYLLLYISA